MVSAKMGHILQSSLMVDLVEGLHMAFTSSALGQSLAIKVDNQEVVANTRVDLMADIQVDPVASIQVVPVVSIQVDPVVDTLEADIQEAIDFNNPL
jgi:hypothetical protein